MKKIKIVYLFLASCIVLLSCSNHIDENRLKNTDEKVGIKIELSIFDEQNANNERTILPSYNTNLLTDIVLTGKRSTATDYTELKTWKDYDAFRYENYVILDADGDKITSTWDFILTANSAGGKLSGSRENLQINTSTTTLRFTLEEVSDADASYGGVEVTFDLSELTDWNIDKITACWNQEADEPLVKGDEPDTLVYRKKNVKKESYLLVFKLYSGDKLILTYPTSVLVKTGALSQTTFSASTLNSAGTLSIVTVAYNYNNGTGGIKTHEYKNTSHLYGSYELTEMFAPIGKAFCGWNTKSDGTGDRYAAGAAPLFSKNITLYAQWCTYEVSSKIYAIKDEADLRAFFHISERAEAWLDADISLAADWMPIDFNGTFDGNSYTISKVSLKPATYTNAGFFSSLGSDATVKNLTIAKASISGENAGALVGENKGTVTGVRIEGSVSNVVTGSKNAGGVAGINYGTIKNATVDGIKITSSGEGANIGGIAGQNEASGSVTSPIVSGANITDGGSAYRVAGIVGYNNGKIASAEIRNSKITGNYTYAYVNEIAVGVSGAVSDTGECSGNTISGNKNVIAENAPYTVSASNSNANLFKDFNSVRRPGNLKLKIIALNKGGTALVYNGSVQDTSTPNSKPSNAVLYSTYNYLNNNTYSPAPVELPSTSRAYIYTLRIYNSNWAIGSGALSGYYSIELD